MNVRGRPGGASTRRRTAPVPRVPGSAWNKVSASRTPTPFSRMRQLLRRPHRSCTLACAVACAVACATLLAGCAAGRRATADTAARFGDANMQAFACADDTRVEVQPLPAALPELAGHIAQSGVTAGNVPGTPIRLRTGPGTPVFTLLPAELRGTAPAVERWRSADGATEWFGRRGGAMALRDATTGRLLARDCRLQSAR